MAAFDEGADLSGVDVWGVANGVSIPTLKFQFQDDFGNAVPAGVGTTYTLQTTEDLDVVQQRDFNTQEPMTWPDGRPRLNIVVTGTLIETNVPASQYSDGDDDAMIRRFFFKGQSQQALQQALKQSGMKRFGIGTKIRITLTGYKPSQKGNPQKLYSVEILEPQQYVAPQQQQAEQALNQQAQANFPPAQAPAASAAPVQAVAQPAQVQPVQQPAQPAAAPQPVQQPAPVQAAQPVAQQIAEATIPAAPAQPAEVAQPAAPAPEGNAQAIKADYDNLSAIGIDHDLAVSSLSTKYGVDAAVVEAAVAI